jgi:hypothetical protein
MHEKYHTGVLLEDTLMRGKMPTESSAEATPRWGMGGIGIMLSLNLFAFFTIV